MSMVQRTPQQELVARIRQPEFKEQIRLALPVDLPPDRFVRAAVTALMQNPDLADTEANSLLQSLIKCAQDGLLPDGREAALVSFYDKKAQVKKAQYLPMVGGYRKIAGEHGWAIRSAVVYENDIFDFELGLDPKLVHRPPRPGEPRGNPIAAYAVGAHRDGRREFEVLDAAEIEKVRQASRAKDYGPWVDWPERMWEKTCARRLFKKLPLGGYERVERVLAAELDPGDSAAQIYGAQAREVFQDPPTVGTVPADAATLSLSGSGDGQQAGDAESSPSPAASSAPDRDEARALAEGAGRIPVPAKVKPFAGQPIRQVHEDGDQAGLDFLRHALGTGCSWNQPGDPDALFGTAVHAYVAHFLPELLDDGKAAAA